MIRFEAYLDESCTNKDDKVFAVAGYLVESEKASKMDSAWRVALTKHDIDYFHMVDCAHGNGQFAKYRDDKKKLIEIETEFLEIIKKYISLGAAAVINRKRFDQAISKADIYSIALEWCMVPLLGWLSDPRNKGEIAFFFEDGHADTAIAHQYVKNLSKQSIVAPYYGGHGFYQKVKKPILQAADVLAWQVTKYVKCLCFESRPMRKDFVSLLEAPHFFNYLTYDTKRGPLVSFDKRPNEFNPLMISYIHSMFKEGAEHEKYLQWMYDQFAENKQK